MKTRDVQEKKRLFGARLLTLLTLVAVLLAAVTLAPALAQEDPGMPDGEQAPASAAAVAQVPDFDSVDDPLNGDYELFTVDDLVLSPPNLIQTGATDYTMQTDIFIMETENETVSSQVRKNVANPPCAVSPSFGSVPQFARAGRFFALPYDVVVTVAPTATNAFTNCDGNGADNMALYVDDAVSGQATAVYPFSFWPYLMVVAEDDFNKDGFADLFILSQNEAGTNAEGIVATAADVNDRSQGLTFGPKVQSSGIASSRFDPVTGDFNADGLLDVAWIGQGKVHFATVCPGDTPGTLCAGKEALEIIFDPLQSQDLPIGTGRGFLGLAAGHFVNEPGDGLVAFDTIGSSSVAQARARWFEFNGDFSIEGGAARDVISNYVTSPYWLQMQAEAAPLNWLGDDLEQVVFAYGGAYNCSEVALGGFRQATVGVISFTSEQMSEVHIAGGRSSCTFTGYLDYPWMDGLAVGHFADIADNPSSNSAFNLQFATYNEMGRVRIYTVNPAENNTPVFASEFDTVGVPANNVLTSTNWMAAGDLQGRSEHLGPPSVIRVESHSQPSVVLGAPPMHVDYIQPDASTASSADIVNFSAAPSDYRSSYTMSQTSSNQSSDTSTTSYTYATAEEGQLGISLKPPYLPSVSGKIKTTTSDKNETVSTDYAFQQNEFTYNASTATGFGDEIWVADNSFNLYVYPVLGETVCPADNGNCAPDEEVPLYVTFSGPNSSGTGPVSGATTEWYQPVHEPGNILSYPWNQSQLEYGIGNINLLTDAGFFYTDDAITTETLGWSVTGGDSATAGSVNTHSYEKGYSITAGKQIGKILDINFEGDLDYNESSSLQTLNQSTSSMGASQGIAITKPGNFLNPGLYQYRVAPYIFGRLPAPDAVDNPILPETVKTYGPLQASFAANPLLGGGSWWTSSENPYAQSIDVALNHPVRWTRTVKEQSDSLNCLGSDCLTFNDPDPNNLWNSEFYWMRGLFVTVGGQSGPQRTQATAGDNVYLTARVYNYSLLDMPGGSKIKVRFYRQEVNGTLPSGNSVLIDEVEINPLVGFNSDSAPDTPNWATAAASFDTTTLGGTNHLFWVVVWAEDSSGAIISELPGHGLSAKPGTLNAIGDVPLEMVTFNGEQKTFSNNVGYLHSRFYIAPAGTQAPAPLVDPVLTIENAMATPSEAAPGEKIIISADVTSLEAAAGAVTVQFFPDAAAWQAYQQDPTQPAPRAFDVELLPYIGKDETDILEVPFRTSAACGTQEILIVAWADAQSEPVTATAELGNGPCQVYFPVLPVQPTK